MSLPDPQQRYAQLEQLYSSEKWLELEALVGAWLLELESNEIASEMAEADSTWRPRLWLLMGHARLYGFGDSTGAASYFGQVLANSGGPQDGLWQELAKAGLAELAELAELSKGLLRVVIKANAPQQQSPS